MGGNNMIQKSLQTSNFNQYIKPHVHEIAEKYLYNKKPKKLFMTIFCQLMNENTKIRSFKKLIQIVYVSLILMVIIGSRIHCLQVLYMHLL